MTLCVIVIALNTNTDMAKNYRIANTKETSQKFGI